MLIQALIPTFVQSNSPLEGDFCLWSMEKVQFYNKIEEIVKSLGFLLIDLIVRGDNHLRIVELFIDGEKAITTDDCAHASRVINEAIETEGLIDESYRLDVSSPGVERPLKFLVQYNKHLNRKFELTFKDGDEEKKINAKLTVINGNALFFQENKNEYKIDFKDIIKAKVLISF